MPHYCILKIFINTMIKMCAMFMYTFNNLVFLRSLLATGHLSCEISADTSS